MATIFPWPLAAAVLLGTACGSPAAPQGAATPPAGMSEGGDDGGDAGRDRSCADPSIDHDGDGFTEEPSSLAFRPDIYVQVDVMSCEILDDNVLKRLDGPVRERLERQFASAPVFNDCGETCGLKLHMQVNRIPECDRVVHKTDFICDRELPSPTPGSGNKRHVLWGDRFKGNVGLNYSGLASGRRMFVSLGNAYRRELSEDRLIQLESAVLMHELGHSLGLTHGHPSCSRVDVEEGGCDSLPNHLSVMSRYWTATGVAYGVATDKPREYVPTYQGFDTAPLLEQGGARVLVSAHPGRCTPPLESPETLSWVRYGETQRPVPVSTPVPGAEGQAVDLNGDDRRGSTLWSAPGGDPQGIPNEWHWMVEQRRLRPASASSLTLEDAVLCMAARLERLSTVKSMAGQDPIVDFDHIPDEPTIDGLLVDLLGAP